MDVVIMAEEAAKLRGVTAETIRRWARIGWLKKARRVGRHTWLLDRAEVLAFEPPKPGPKKAGRKGSDV